ncbi:MAG: hypothetical protein ABI091_14790 [Ferruginibacter sp.]
MNTEQSNAIFELQKGETENSYIAYYGNFISQGRTVDEAVCLLIEIIIYDLSKSKIDEPIKDEEYWINKFKPCVMSYDQKIQEEVNEDAIICLEIAKQYASSIQNNSAGVWVKASEILPTIKNEDFFIRYNNVRNDIWDKEVTSNLQYVKELIENGWDDVEWLDESKQNNVEAIDKWIDAKKELPPENTIVHGFNKKWIDEEYNPEGVRSCFMDQDGEWNSAKWDNEQDNWHNESTWAEKGHYWYGVAPTHWKPLPKPPNQ